MESLPLKSNSDESEKNQQAAQKTLASILGDDKLISGNYTLSISVTSKSNSSNTLNKSIPVVNNPLGRFMGYKVDVIEKSKNEVNWSDNSMDGLTIDCTPIGHVTFTAAYSK